MYHEQSMRKRTIILRTILAGLLIIPGYMAITYNRVGMNVSPLLTLGAMAAATAGGFLGASAVIRNATRDLSDDARARVALPISATLVALVITCGVLSLRAPTITARGAIIGLSLGVLFAGARNVIAHLDEPTEPDEEYHDAEYPDAEYPDAEHRTEERA